MAADGRKIAVLGANGRLSRVAARAFAAAGFDVRAVTRTGSANSGDGFEMVAGDMMRADDAIAVTRDCDFIFNGINPIYTRWPAEVMPMARNVLEAAAANGAIHLFPGNVYNYGTAIPPVVSENTPQFGDHRKAAIRIEAERLFAEAAAGRGVKTLILRAGDFFGGDGRGSWFDTVIARALDRGKVTYPGPANAVHAWAYLPDLAAAFVTLAQKADSLSKFETLHFPGHAVTGRDLHQAIERAMGRPLKEAGFPWPVIRVGGLFYPMWRDIAEMAYLWKRPHRLSGDKLARLIGPLSATPLDEALSKALEELNIRATRPAFNARALPTMAA